MHRLDEHVLFLTADTARHLNATLLFGEHINICDANPVATIHSVSTDVAAAGHDNCSNDGALILPRMPYQENVETCNATKPPKKLEVSQYIERE